MEKRTTHAKLDIKKDNTFEGIKMQRRKIEDRIRRFLSSDRGALLVTGARQVGKTYSIRKVCRESGRNFVEINFIDVPAAVQAVNSARNAKELLFRISALTDQKLIPHQTIIFFDEVQKASEIVTAIKFLVEEGSYQYILSGSLLGVELKSIRSVPVGYMDMIRMYPMDFEEFCMGNGVADRIIQDLEEHFSDGTPVDPVVHSQMMSLFRLYLVVGGMPAAVQEYIDSNNVQRVLDIQRSIVEAYRADIGQYDPDHKLYIDEIFDLIPAELNSKNKRFIMKELNKNFKFRRYYNSFLWLEDAGVALPTYCADEPRVPIKLSQSTNLFKLFLSDVGLLASMYMDGIQIRILNNETDINFGSVYENAAAQELKAHGFELYYFNSKKQGEVDFLIEKEDQVIPLEIKSGKNYQKHSALSNLLADKNYGIRQAIVFSNDNVTIKGKIRYLPIYMLMFLKKEEKMVNPIFKPDISALKE